MALSYSTGLRNFAQSYGSYKRALEGGIIEIRTGAAPATADAAITGTLLCTVSLASATVTKEVTPVAVVTLSGSGGSVDSITIDGKEILGVAVSWDTDLATTAIAVAAQITKYQPPKGAKFIATSSAGVVRISALPGTGTSGNGLACTAGATTMDATCGEGTMGGTGGVGVNSSGGLTYGVVTAGVLSKAGVWSGTNLVTGVAGYFRILGPVNDAGTASTTAPRIQGVCGIASGDYPMTSTTLTINQTHTVDTFTHTLPAA